jgi:hypothetical protein
MECMKAQKEAGKNLKKAKFPEFLRDVQKSCRWVIALLHVESGSISQKLGITLDRVGALLNTGAHVA